MLRLHTTLSLYIGRYFAMALLGTLAVILALVLMLDFVELLRRAAGRDAGATVLFSLSLMKLPTMAHQVLPFAVLVGGMIAMWRLSRSHELIIIRASGVSVWQFLAPMVLCAAVVGVLDVTAVNPLSSALYRSYEKRLDEVWMPARAGAFNLSESGMWLREPVTDGGQTVVHAGHVRQDGDVLHMRDLMFIMLDSHGVLYRRIDAGQGAMKDRAFILRDAWIMEPNHPGVRMDEVRLPTGMTLARVQENFASPETLSFWDLPGFIRFFETSGFSAQRHWMHLHGLLASPVLLCAMVIVAAVFSLDPDLRSGRGLSRILGAVGVGFVLYFFTRLSLALGLSSAVPLWLSAWTPTLVALLLGTATLLHQEDG